MSIKIREKCPQEFTHFVLENLPFMSTRILPPTKNPFPNQEDLGDSWH